jgi:spermidine/putrescine transport system ATP-binding protein
MSEVRLEGLSKSFKETVAVVDLDLTVREGEFFSLLGPSGCGKTTTLRMIGGFEEPTSGRVFLGGSDVTDLPPNKRDVNTVFQSYALFPHLNVGENVAYGLKRKHVPAKDISTRIAEMMALVRLEGYEARKVHQLSGGQQQRVALARALVNRPQVLLLDEPLGALDLKLRKQMQLELKRIQQEVGITFIYVTHDQEEAMTMSDRIAVMEAGRFEQVGPPQEVYDLPATEFVAGFLGASNLLSGTVMERSGDLVQVKLTDGATIEVPAERVTDISGAIKVGVRPEKIVIVPAGQGPPQSNLVKATVVDSSYTGVSRSYGCRTEGGDTVVVYVQTLGDSARELQEGATVTLAWEPRHTFAVTAASTEGEGVT